MRPATSTSDYSIRSVERALDVLEHLSNHPDSTITDTSREMGIDKSTVARQFACLARRGFVMRDPTSGRYNLGYKLLDLGTRVAERSRTRDVAYPYMVLLRDRVEETVGLYERAGAGRACVAQVESRQELRRTLPVGAVRGLYPGAPGKPFMAFMPAAQLEPIIADAARLRFVDGRQVDPAALRDELEQVRRQGFAFSSQEQVPGGASLCVPIWDFRGQVAAVVAVSAPSTRMRGEHLAYIIGEALATGAAISKALGAAGSSRSRQDPPFAPSVEPTAPPPQ